MIVIGAGRIGRALHSGAPHDVTLVDRTSGWDALAREPGEPVVLAVRNDDLDSVLERVPERRRSDLVFVQNGALREFLADRGLASATRGVLYVLVEREAAYEGDTRTAPIARTSSFRGPHASHVAEVFARAGMPAVAVEQDAFAVSELEKLVWITAYGPLCDALALPVGAVGEAVPDALVELVAELGTVVAAAWGVPVPDTVLEHAVTWSDAIPRYRAAVKEWPWRNGWIEAQAARRRLPTTHHRRWLTAAGH